MKCPNCGAEIKNGFKICEYCGSSLPAQMKRDQEYVHKAGCPNCGSSNISFNREKQGLVREGNGTAILHSTVGLCEDCGYTWEITASNSNSSTSSNSKNNNKIWWVLGWLFFWPAPLMVLIWRDKCKWDIKVKIGVTVAFWLLVFLIGRTGNSSASAIM